MIYLFVSVVILLILTIPIHFLSIEHKKLIKKYGKEKGEKYGMLFGKISGYGHFFLCFIIWTLPQPNFQVSNLFNITVPIINITISIVHVIVALPFIIAFTIIESIAVKAVSMKTATTHSVEKLIFTGIYSIIRHPQHLGQLLLFIGMTVLFSGLYSLIFFPFYIIIIIILSKKEEKELIIEFGDEYKRYRERVPMIIPRLKINKFTK